ncbi:MAG: UPF0175 family protein [Bacteroidales bacterium]
MTMQFAALLFHQGILSSAQAEEMIGVSKRSFRKKVGEYGVSLINYPPSEISVDASRI